MLMTTRKQFFNFGVKWEERINANVGKIQARQQDNNAGKLDLRKLVPALTSVKMI